MSDTSLDQPAQQGPTAGPSQFSRLLQTLRGGDIALAMGVVAILVVLILPMPGWMLDFALAISITFSVLILMTSLFIHRPLEFSAFPTVLLIATMLRLALNLASTRLILGHGHEGPDAAGRVIQAFGDFVMSGNAVIGAIVFTILVIVNFVVITKGSGRIAEVAARFSLDALPGKQMAIDADLSAGLIDETAARTRRKDLEDENSFFGAMDGAAKFVRGDAIAGLLITFINVIGGIVVGVAQMGLSFSEAGSTYLILTVGDGLVTQIPAIIVSTSAGLLVSKAGVTGSTDKALFKQLSGYPKALGVSSFLMFCLALLPGIPMIPFLVLSGLSGWVASRVSRRSDVEAAKEVAEDEESEEVAEEPISSALAIDQIRLELGYGLLPLINDTSTYRLTDQIKALRRQLASEAGFVMPSVRILDNMQLPANSYVIRVKEAEAGQGDLRPNSLLVMDPTGGEVAIAGEDTLEPTFGLPAKWVDQGLADEASFRGYTVVDAPTVITTHLTEVIKDNMADLLSYAEVQKLLNDLGPEHKKLLDDIVPSQFTVNGLQRVLQNLLSERVSIRDLPSILEGVAEATVHSQSVTVITEHVRGRLARQISATNLNPQGHIPLVVLSPEWELAFSESLIGQGEDKQLAMAPSKLQEFIQIARDILDQQAMAGELPVVLTSPMIRPYVRSVIERFRPSTVVMSQNEIHPKVNIRTLGQI